MTVSWSLNIFIYMQNCKWMHIQLCADMCYNAETITARWLPCKSRICWMRLNLIELITGWLRRIKLQSSSHITDWLLQRYSLFQGHLVIWELWDERDWVVLMVIYLAWQIGDKAFSLLRHPAVEMSISISRTQALMNNIIKGILVCYPVYLRAALLSDQLFRLKNNSS